MYQHSPLSKIYMAEDTEVGFGDLGQKGNLLWVLNSKGTRYLLLYVLYFNPSSKRVIFRSVAA